jgi:hypothetical protein
LPDSQLSKDKVVHWVSAEMARITGIKVPEEEEEIEWSISPHQSLKDYAGPHEYFLDDGLMGWHYVPKIRLPGERWRIDSSQASHEISAVIQRIQMFKEGYLTVEERLTRWGLTMYIATKIKEFQSSYLDRPGEWSRVLLVLDVREEDIRTTTEFSNEMHHLNPIYDLIPIRVLEVITVFRVMFRVSLQEFELAYRASEN